MTNEEDELSRRIDRLNAEQSPEGGGQVPESRSAGDSGEDELDRLTAAARAAKSLREPNMPAPGYPERLARAVAAGLDEDARSAGGNKDHMKPRPMPATRIRMPRARVLIAAGLALAIIVAGFGLLGKDAVHAMERAVAGIASFHGVMEVRSRNAAGDEWLVHSVEVWSAGTSYAVRQPDGTLTVNDGQQKWQISPSRREVALLPAIPDPTRRGLDLREEAARAAGYPHRVVGKELVAGREASKVEVSPPGGLPYWLWIDARTDLPVKLLTAMQNAMQTEYLFVTFEPNADIDPAAFAYLPPDGYTVVAENPGQQVASVAEAEALSGLSPVVPAATPDRIVASVGSIVFDYGDTVIVETAPDGDFEVAPNASLGSAAGGAVEVLRDRLRWRQAGLELAVEGNRRIELAEQVAPDMTLPRWVGPDRSTPAQVVITPDMDEVRANQQQVDGGHSPWQLDPVQVAMVFVNAYLAPDGWEGQPPVAETEFTLASNDGGVARVSVGSSSPISMVYLKRLVRQDQTGIWTVVGYDNACST